MATKDMGDNKDERACAMRRLRALGLRLSRATVLDQSLADDWVRQIRDAHGELRASRLGRKHELETESGVRIRFQKGRPAFPMQIYRGDFREMCEDDEWWVMDDEDVVEMVAWFAARRASLRAKLLEALR